MVIFLSITLIIADLAYHGTKQGRSYISVVLTPLLWLADLPVKAASELSDVVVDRGLLVQENARMKREALSLQHKVQQYDALATENKHLRALLSSSARVQESVRLVELIGVNPDPFQHQIIIGQGTDEGVYLGQPVLDAGGVMGQVVETSLYTARVMLITDARHAIPVEVDRNGFRTVALGQGDRSELVLDYISDTVDVREGDLLVTSGLSGRFPRGYPVGVIKSIRREPGAAFADVRVTPTALLNRSRHLLLVLPPEELAPPNQDAQDTQESSLGTTPASLANQAEAQ